MKKLLKRIIVISCIICAVFFGSCLVIQFGVLLGPRFSTFNINPEWNTTHTAYYDGAYYFYRSGANGKGEICRLKDGEETSLFSCKDPEAIAVGKYGIYLSDSETLLQYDLQGKEVGRIDKSETPDLYTCINMFTDDENGWLFVVGGIDDLFIFDCKCITDSVDVLMLNSKLKKNKEFARDYDSNVGLSSGKKICSLYELGQYYLISCSTNMNLDFSFSVHKTGAAKGDYLSNKQRVSITDKNGNLMYPTHTFLLGTPERVYANVDDYYAQLLIFSDEKQEYAPIRNGYALSDGKSLFLNRSLLYTIGKYHDNFWTDLVFRGKSARDQVAIQDLESGKIINDFSLERGEHIVGLSSEEYVLLKGRKLQIYQLENRDEMIKEYRLPVILPGYQYTFEVNHEMLFLYRLPQSAYNSIEGMKKYYSNGSFDGWKYVGCYEL